MVRRHMGRALVGSALLPRTCLRTADIVALFPVKALGERLSGRRLHPRRHGLTRGGGRARALAILPQKQAPHPRGAARRRHGLGPALNPHQLMVGGGRGFRHFHRRALSRRARAPLPATLFSSSKGSPWAGQKLGCGGGRPGRCRVAAALRTTRSWSTTRRPCLWMSLDWAKPSKNGVSALRRWRDRVVVDALHVRQGLDGAPGEVGMSGKADGQTTPGLLEGGVEAWSARWRLLPPSATVCSEDDDRHTFAGAQRGRHRWGHGSLILWLQPPRQPGTADSTQWAGFGPALRKDDFLPVSA